MDTIHSFLSWLHSTPFIKAHGETLLLMAATYLVGRYGIRFIADRLVRAASDGDATRLTGREKRAATLAGIITTTGNVTLGLVLLALGLRLAGVDTTTILGAAGLMSFAVGLGTQSLIKDFIAGLFILAENQYAIDDRVKINDKEGVVRRMSIRTTVLEVPAKTDAETGATTPGCLIFIPNGGITSVCNYSLGEQPPPPTPPAALAAPQSSDA